MALILGVHNGHHASCAVVRDGILVAAVEQERLTGIKGDGSDGLTNRLPVHACLGAAGAALDDVDLIVSSFQSMAPGGIGLARPLAEPGFSLFDPYDARHIVVSHHLAHALCAVGSAGFRETVVVVSDLAGSTTRDGRDFVCSFSELERALASMESAASTLTECLSIYEIDDERVELMHREYCVPHNTPEVFVCSAASLYDNVSRLVFDRDNAHGELMALASMAGNAPAEVSVDDLIETRGAHDTVFRNDWQNRIRRHHDVLGYAPLARVVQLAFERVLLNSAIRARSLSAFSCFAGAGGAFLNINANSRIASTGLFDKMFVPSSPHDAGIAVGCAYHGWRVLAGRSRVSPTVQVGPVTDRLGTAYLAADHVRAVAARYDLLEEPAPSTPGEVADLLLSGAIVGRFAGRAEFGPRALGGRSLLASPFLGSSKDRLNRIKGRQPWRPVAPIIPLESLSDVFEGPSVSPYMNLVHQIKPGHRHRLVALAHPDASARAQTLERSEDPFLHDVLRELGRLTGYPVLVNTSFNGPGDPIVERPEDALDFLLRNEDLDAVLLENDLIRRREWPSLGGSRLADDVIVTWVGPRTARRVILLRGGLALEVSSEIFHLMDSALDSLEGASDDIRRTLVRAAREGFLIPAPEARE